RIKLGVFRSAPPQPPLHAVALERNDVADAVDDVLNAVQMLQEISSASGAGISRAIVAGSVPELQNHLASRWKAALCPLFQIQSACDVGIPLDVDSPERVGVDRALNALAAAAMTGTAPAILCVSGTAITVDLVTSDQVFRGGCILPGMRLSAKALHEHTALLPLLSFPEDDETRTVTAVQDSALREACQPAWLTGLPDVPGRNTEAAMTAGLVLGQLGAVRELTVRLADAARDRYHEQQMPRLLFSGGSGRLLAAHLANAEYVEDLTLQGLALWGYQHRDSQTTRR
ncbi:MAG: type III pantothenate kinase, partial [Planctomycetaceae bacterium]|nr:type III pantothenate kinase [Planctomycetaceae bacterium]